MEIRVWNDKEETSFELWVNTAEMWELRTGDKIPLKLSISCEGAYRVRDRARGNISFLMGDADYSSPFYRSREGTTYGVSVPCETLESSSPL